MMQIKANPDVNACTGLRSCNLHLTPGRVYTVVGIEAEYYRVISDNLEPILYAKELFEIIDPSYPSEWIRREFDDGEYYIEPLEFSGVGFFEDYFEGDEKAKDIYSSYLKSNFLTR